MVTSTKNLLYIVNFLSINLVYICLMKNCIKISLFIFLLGSFTFASHAQRKCGFTDYYNNLILEQPELLENFNDQIQILSNLKTNSSYGIIRIPVVVHVLYNDSIQNISDEQIKSQISVLNRDYNASNLDKLPSSHQFYNKIGNAEIEFCLAKEDAWGNPTTGIERKYIEKLSFKYTGAVNDSDENYIKKSSIGGLDAWDTEKYLNIWIVNFSDGTLGFATFPTNTPNAKDGVVIHYKAFGTVGTLSGTYNKGRTSTHEIGHWLGLKHIWGDNSGCFSDDGISDTPKQYNETYGCPSGIYEDECSPSSTGRMYQNFMDYTDDACMSLFTSGQITVMRNTIINKRSGLLNSSIPCDFISSTSNNLNLKNLKIYPNPASNYLQIEYLPYKQTPYFINIFNELGQIVYQTQTQHTKLEIEVSGLRSGIYYLTINNNGETYNRTISILH